MIEYKKGERGISESYVSVDIIDKYVLPGSEWSKNYKVNIRNEQGK